MKVLLLARFTFKEAVRKKVVLGAVVLSLGFIALFALGSFILFREVNKANFMAAEVRVGMSSQMLLAGLYITNFVSGLLAIFGAVGTISTEVEQGTLHAIVPKSIERWEIILGKWLGFAAMLTIYVIVTTVAVVGVIFAFGNYFPSDPIPALAFMVLETLLLLTITVLGSVVFSSITNGVVVFMLYSIALVSGMLEQFGALLQNNTMANIGITVSLFIPSDALWKMACSLIQPKIILAQMVGPFAVLSPPSNWMLVYSIAYIFVMLGLAVRTFSSKDL